MEWKVVGGIFLVEKKERGTTKKNNIYLRTPIRLPSFRPIISKTTLKLYF